MSKVIGIGGSLHDFAACLIYDNQRVIAIEDERLTKIRYSIGANSAHTPSVDYCLRSANLEQRDVDYIVGDDMIADTFYPNRQRLNHHLAHIYSSFFTSPFRSAAILVVDGVGSLHSQSGTEERETTTYAMGDKNTITILGKVIGAPSTIRYHPSTPRVRSNSLGEFYRAITQAIGFEYLQAGKTMGLSPYGDDRFVGEMMQFVRLESNGQFVINADGTHGFAQSLIDLRNKYAKDGFMTDASLAFAGQYILEYILSHCLQYLWDETHSSNLCLIGGVALNSVANGRILPLTNFKNAHVLFAPGDNGAAIGAAIYGTLLSHSSEAEVRFNLSPYLGYSYSENDMLTAIKERGLSYRSPQNLPIYVALKLDQGCIVAWYQGASEFGPRALGNRSILADPRPAAMKDKLNTIKGREWFRPVAPIVIEEELTTYFDAPFASPWMQFVFPVKLTYHEILRGCTHVDGTARVQTVTQSTHPSLHHLLKAFGDITGIPMLINTSLNIGGKPIVETPSDAIDAFINSKIDLLVLGSYLLEK
jgi:carbamoyltransferase